MKVYVRIITLLLSTIAVLNAQGINKLPGYLAGSNAGTEYYISFPPCYDQESPSGDNSLRVFVASAVMQEVTLEVKGKNYQVKRIAEANGVIEFRLPIDIGQPYLKPINMNANSEQVYKEYAVHITAEHPIIVYGVTRSQYTSDGFLAIPISAFGTEYVIGAYPQYTGMGSTYELPSLSNIVAAHDGTEVTFTMGGTKGSITSGGMKLGDKKKFTLNKGDVLCFANLGDSGDISGSLVQSTKPIGVISGNQCANVPRGVFACDFLSEMELPTYTWGMEYHVTPIIGRQKAPVIRVFAKEANTKVYRDGQYWFDLSLASREEDNSFKEKRVFDGNLDDLVNSGGSPCKVITADKPIYVMLYNPGQTDDNVESDPFQIVLSPYEQYRKEIVFATPNAKGSTAPFTSNYVNLVYQTNDDGSIPDDLEFGIVNNSIVNWKKVNVEFGSNPGYRFIIPINGKKYAMKRLQLNEDGVFRIRAKNPFASYSYGFSSFDSYGFPTSASLFDLQILDTIQPAPAWNQLCDGSIEGINGEEHATIEDNPNNSTSSSKLGLIYMDKDSSFNYKFAYNLNGQFIPGFSTTTDWSLNVINKDKDAKARLVFIDRDGNDTIITVQYRPNNLDITHDNSELKYIRIGESKKSVIELINRNNDSVLIISNIALKSGVKGFSLPSQSFPITIPAGGKTSFEISFSANAKGIFTDTLLIVSGCGITEKILHEALVGELGITTSDIDFGMHDIGQKSVQYVLIRNSGDFDLKITGVKGPKSSNNFKLLNWPLINAQNPLVLSPNETKQFNIEFSPSESINYEDEIIFSSDAKISDSIAVLKGSGKNATSINQDSGESLNYSISQNQYSLIINFKSRINESLTISMTDISGHQVYFKELDNANQQTEHRINLNTLSSGIYLMKLKQGQYVNVEKIIVR